MQQPTPLEKHALACRQSQGRFAWCRCKGRVPVIHYRSQWCRDSGLPRSHQVPQWCGSTVQLPHAHQLSLYRNVAGRICNHLTLFLIVMIICEPVHENQVKHQIVRNITIGQETPSFNSAALIHELEQKRWTSNLGKSTKLINYFLD
jgi:hypothetical protein